MEFYFRGVNDAFASMVEGIHLGEIPVTRKGSRNGEVMIIEQPVTICYERPYERVLFNQHRDCNPFFHLYESLWMLAGRNDVAPLNFYNSQMKNYSDNDKTFNGAYGYRWRAGGSEQDVDQLEILIDRLRNKPEDRRCVLQMWNVEDDLLKINSSKDVACNTNVYFLIREEWDTMPDYQDKTEGHKTRYLDMTVCNRSNDLVWGCFGANAVHFSFLHEYMALGIGVEIGRYYQFSNNLHCYTENDRWTPEKWLKDYEAQNPKIRTMWTEEHVDYTDDYKHCKLFNGPKGRAQFDEEVVDFVEDNYSKEGTEGVTLRKYNNPFLNQVAKPMCRAFLSHKLRDYEAAEQWLDQCVAEDWRKDGLRWITKRKENWERKQK